MRRMLINVLLDREVRIAILNSATNQTPASLYDLHIEHDERKSLKGNIYKARISTVKNELNAAFIDYGDVKQGLLSAEKLIQRRSAQKNGGEDEKQRISDFFKDGDEVLVQIDKDPRSDKGAALTTQIQLQGQHVILLTERGVNRISRMIRGSQRAEIEAILEKIKLPRGMGLVIRTSAAGKDKKTLQRDINDTLDLFNRIQSAYKQSDAPRLLYEENNLVNTVLRNNLHTNIGEILIDNEPLYHETLEYVNDYMPDFDGTISLYKSNLPLFTRFKIEKEISHVFDRSITLPSGGEIVLDPTEALLSVDVNSARYRYKRNFDAMVLNTNLEAVDEVFRQLRLRDIGGLVVIDFIDMQLDEDIKKLENRVEMLCQRDRARTRWEPISRFGLMQLQRRRMSSSIYDIEFETCSECSGHGRIRSVASISHRIFREIEAKSYDKKVARISTHVTPAVASFLTNELRSMLSSLELKSGTKLQIIPDQEENNASYITHSYRSIHSNNPRETDTYEQGRAQNGSDRKRSRSNDRSQPMESIQQPAVERTSETKNGISGKRVGTRGLTEDRTPGFQIGTIGGYLFLPFKIAGQALAHATGRIRAGVARSSLYLYRRLFVVEPVVNQRSTPTRSKVDVQAEKPPTDSRKSDPKSAQNARQQEPASKKRESSRKNNEQGGRSTERPANQRRPVSSDQPNRKDAKDSQRTNARMRDQEDSRGENKSTRKTRPQVADEREKNQDRRRSEQTQSQTRKKTPRAEQPQQTGESAAATAISESESAEDHADANEDNQTQTTASTNTETSSTRDHNPSAKPAPDMTQHSVNKVEAENVEQTDSVGQENPREPKPTQHAVESESDEESSQISKSEPLEATTAHVNERPDTRDSQDSSNQSPSDEAQASISDEGMQDGVEVVEPSDEKRASNDPRNIRKERPSRDRIQIT